MQLKKASIYLLMTLSLIILAASCKGSSGSVGTIGKEGGEWVLKLDKITLYQNQFDKEYDFALQMSGQYSPEQIALLKNDDRAKQDFLEGLISQILVLKKADDEKFFETEDAKDFMDYAVRSLKVQYYTQKMLDEAITKVPDPTQQDITAFYNQYKAQLAEEGVTELNAQTIAYLSQYIKMQQAQQSLMRDVTDLKDKAVIERNKAVIGDITTMPTNPAIPQTQTPQNTENTNNVLR